MNLNLLKKLKEKVINKRPENVSENSRKDDKNMCDLNFENDNSYYTLTPRENKNKNKKGMMQVVHLH